MKPIQSKAPKKKNYVPMWLKKLLTIKQFTTHNSQFIIIPIKPIQSKAPKKEKPMCLCG